MPVADTDLPLAEAVFESRRNKAEFAIVVVRTGNQNQEAVLYREAGGDDKDVFGESFVLRIADFVEDLPGDEHGHDDGFAGAGGHLGAEAGKVAAIAWDVDTSSFRGRGFGQPDEGFDGFELAEEEAVVFALLGVTPMFEEASGNAAHAGIASVAP